MPPSLPEKLLLPGLQLPDKNLSENHEELGIPFWNFYKAKQKYRRADEQDAQPGQFVQLASGRYVPQTMPPARTAGKSGRPVKLTEEKNENYLTVELQTRTGTAMRIQGVMTPAHLRELIAAGNV